MKTLIKNARISCQDNELTRVTVLLNGNKIEKIFYEPFESIKSKNPEFLSGEEISIFDAENKLLSLGFVDTHVHLREPGFTEKEDIYTGSRAAVMGGYTTIMAMPNVRPVPDDAEKITRMYELAASKSIINVKFYSSITKGETGGELVDFPALQRAGAIAFSDDGKGMQNSSLCKAAMQEVAKIGGIFAQHCEDEDLLNKGYITEGEYARTHNHRGISNSVEEVMLARDLILARETSCKYHVCHMSTAGGADLLRLAKESWHADVSAEITPHHLLLSENNLQEDGNWKMNPPLRSEEDRLAMIDAVKSGLVNIIATDHAPHTIAEKSKGLADSYFGITGLETAFPLLYTKLVLRGEITLHQLLNCLTTGPATRFGIEDYELKDGVVADLVLLDLHKNWQIKVEEHKSKGRNNPFDGWEVKGRITDVWCGGKQILSDGELLA